MNRRIVYSVALLTLCCAARTACADEQPVQLKILNAVQKQPELVIAMCDAQRHCKTRSLESQQVSALLPVAPSRYDFTVSDNHDHVLDRFSYGLAAGEQLTLCLFGLAEKPVTPSLFSQLKTFFGGEDQQSSHAYQMSHRMVPMKPGTPDDPPQIILAHFVPGLKPLALKIDSPADTQQLAPVNYSTFSDKKSVGKGDDEIGFLLKGRQTPLNKTSLRLPPGSVSLVAAETFDGKKVSFVVDQRQATVK